MKNILYTGPFRFPSGDAAAARILNNAKIFKLLGYNVTIISWGGRPCESDKCGDGNYYYEGFRYVNTGDIDGKENNVFRRLFRHFFSGKKALNITARMIDDINVVIAYNPSMYFTNKMLSLCKQHSIAFVSDLTEWYDPNEFPGGKLAPPSWINELNMTLTQKKIRNKIVISSFLNNYYKKSNNIILPPLIDRTEIKWSNSKTVLPFFDGVRIIYAGNPSKKDLLATMLDAVISCLKKGLKLQFVIVGVSKENIKNYTNNQDVFSLRDNILFCGRVDQTEVPSYYKVSDFSIIIREKTRKNMAGFPTKLAESMMAGCPVILNYTSDIANYVSDGYNGFVISDHSSTELEAILSNIVNLSRNDVSLMKSNAIKSAIEKIDYSNFVDEMNDFIVNMK